ncbi:MAG: phenylalanine--tRNA ligase subunit beta [Armatimonadota bacterium]
MLLSVEWIRDFVRVEESPEELAERLTLTGNEIEQIRDSAAGPVLDLKLTPNRADMLSHLGAARELSALYGAELDLPESRLAAAGPAAEDVRVEVEAPDLCPRYAARLIRGVRVGPSPDWLRARLEAVGLRSISNVVDVTNYVMYELGQPLHAFDLDRLAGRAIVVRRARPGERIIAIDGTEVEMDPNMLAICDAERPVAIAGVMGGLESEVSDATTDVLLESAYFDPTSVRRTAKRTGITSPASYRFERGVDPNGVVFAADRAAQLIAELSGGTVSESLFDLYPAPIEPRSIRLRPQRARDLLGVEVSDADAERYLAQLGFQVERESADEWRVTVPTNRPDLAIEEDLIEEVGRLYGYDRLPETLPGGIAAPGRLSAQEELIRRTRELLTGQGLYEAVSSTLVASTFLREARLEASPAWNTTEAGPVRPVSLRNPLSEEFDTLRPSLIPGLILAVQHNLRHGVKDAFLFETGYGHRKVGDGFPEDRLLVAGVMLGSRWSDAWNADKALATDFFQAKGAVEALVAGLGVPPLQAEPAEAPAFHPGRTAWLTLGRDRIGLVGELHPEVSARLDLPRGLYAFELDGEALLAHQSRSLEFRPPSRFPRALRDLAVVVDASVPSGRIEELLWESLGEVGRRVRLFDVYAGPNLPEGKVSLAYAVEMGAEDRTLTDAEVEARIADARERLTREVRAEFRG